MRSTYDAVTDDLYSEYYKPEFNLRTELNCLCYKPSMVQAPSWHISNTLHYTQHELIQAVQSAMTVHKQAWLFMSQQCTSTCIPMTAMSQQSTSKKVATKWPKVTLFVTPSPPPKKRGAPATNHPGKQLARIIKDNPGHHNKSRAVTAHQSQEKGICDTFSAKIQPKAEQHLGYQQTDVNHITKSAAIASTKVCRQAAITTTAKAVDLSGQAASWQSTRPYTTCT